MTCFTFSRFTFPSLRRVPCSGTADHVARLHTATHPFRLLFGLLLASGQGLAITIHPHPAHPHLLRNLLPRHPPLPQLLHPPQKRLPPRHKRPAHLLRQLPLAPMRVRLDPMCLVNRLDIFPQNPPIHAQLLHHLLPRAVPQHHLRHLQPPHFRLLPLIQPRRRRKIQLPGQRMPIHNSLLPANHPHMRPHVRHRQPHLPRNLKIRPVVSQPRQHLPPHRRLSVQLPDPCPLSPRNERRRFFDL